MEFVRTLRELSATHLDGEVVGVGPVLVYGARIVAPDAPAELYVSIGALTLVHLLGIGGAASKQGGKLPEDAELPADMALLFTAASQPDQHVLRP